MWACFFLDREETLIHEKKKQYAEAEARKLRCVKEHDKKEAPQKGEEFLQNITAFYNALVKSASRLKCRSDY